MAFSGKDASHVSYTTLTTDPFFRTILTAETYAYLTTQFINTFLYSPLFSFAPSLSPSTLLSKLTILSINYPLLTCPNCSHLSDITFILTRALPTHHNDDVEICKNGGRLPVESDAVRDESGCWASVSVLNAESKSDIGKDV